MLYLRFLVVSVYQHFQAYIINQIRLKFVDLLVQFGQNPCLQYSFNIFVEENQKYLLTYKDIPQVNQTFMIQ